VFPSFARRGAGSPWGAASGYRSSMAGVTAGDGWRTVRYAGVMRYPDGGGLTAAEREPQQVAEIVDRQLDRLFGA
jgi:hypothetical protein